MTNKASLICPPDTLKVLVTLIRASKDYAAKGGLPNQLLLMGALEDAISLSEEIVQTNNIGSKIINSAPNFYHCEECKNASNSPDGIPHSQNCSQSKT